MASSYAYIREQVVQGVIRRSPVPPPLDRIRAIFDASFFVINSQVAEAFAARNDRRELLRVVESLTFTAGTATLPTDTLKKFMPDATLAVSGTLYGFRKYPDYVRGHDPRLGAFTQIGESILANKPQNAGVLSGAATLSSIKSPAVPATESATFVAPEDYYPELIDAMTQFILGQSVEAAAETA